MAETRTLSQTSSEALLERYRDDGDVAAIGVLFDREAPGLYRVALAICRDPGAAEDALQQAFIEALDHVDRYTSGRPVGAWLLGIRKAEPPAFAVSKKPLKTWQVMRRRDDQDFTDAGKHQCRQRIIDHRLVVDRDQLLAHSPSNRMQP